MSAWQRVVFAADCDEDGNCPVCGIDFAECPCIGPTEDAVEYKTRNGVLYGRRKPAPTEAELAASRDRLVAAGYSIAVWRDGSMRVVVKKEVVGVWMEGATVFSPQEMFDYVRAPEHGRKLIRGLKGLR